MPWKPLTLSLAQALLSFIRLRSALALLAYQVTLVRVHSLPQGHSHSLSAMRCSVSQVHMQCPIPQAPLSGAGSGEQSWHQLAHAIVGPTSPPPLVPIPSAMLASASRDGYGTDVGGDTASTDDSPCRPATCAAVAVHIRLDLTVP